MRGYGGIASFISHSDVGKGQIFQSYVMLAILVQNNTQYVPLNVAALASSAIQNEQESEPERKKGG